MKYYLLCAIILFVACNRTHEAKVMQSLNIYSVYGLEKEMPDIERLKIALKGLPMYSTLKDKLDFYSTELLTSKAENILIYIIQFAGDPNKVYAVKGMIAKTLVISDEVLYSRKIKDKQNGSIGILKNNEALSVEYKDGKPLIRSLSENEYKAEFTKNDEAQSIGFCQRRIGQTFGDCYKFESEEFCDSFFSCLAINTQPQVHILIAIACSCDWKATMIYVPEREKTFDSLWKKFKYSPFIIDSPLVIPDSLP